LDDAAIETPILCTLQRKHRICPRLAALFARQCNLARYSASTMNGSLCWSFFQKPGTAEVEVATKELQAAAEDLGRRKSGIADE
jgi:hypothetical protein